MDRVAGRALLVAVDGAFSLSRDTRRPAWPSDRREGGDDALLELEMEIRRLEGCGGGKRACASSSRAHATSRAREAESSLLCDDWEPFDGSRANGGCPRVTVEGGARWRRLWWLKRPLETAEHRPPSWSIG
jgi:hypothetical protein